MNTSSNIPTQPTPGSSSGKFFLWLISLIVLAALAGLAFWLTGWTSEEATTNDIRTEPLTTEERGGILESMKMRPTENPSGLTEEEKGQLLESMMQRPSQ